MSAKIKLGWGLFLGVVALAITLSSGAPEPAAVCAAMAALAAAGSWVGLGLGLVALSVGLGPGEPTSALTLAAAALSGLGIGAMLRAIEPAESWLTKGRSVSTGVLLLGLVVLATVVPDSPAQLVDAQGQPLLVDAVIQDALTGRRAATVVPAIIEVPAPAAGNLDLAPWVALGGAFLLLLSRAGRERPRVERFAWMVAAVAAGLVLASGALGQVELFGAAVTLPTEGELATALSRSAGGAIAVRDLQLPAEAFLALHSRPGVDVLRIVAGLAVLALALRQLWRPPAVPVEAPDTLGGPFLLGGLALMVVGCFLAPGTGTALALVSAIALGAGALVSGSLIARGARAPFDLVVAGAIVGILAWIGPAAGWIPS